jgi:hypothetical protein
MNKLAFFNDRFESFTQCQCQDERPGEYRNEIENAPRSVHVDTRTHNE